MDKCSIETGVTGYINVTYAERTKTEDIFVVSTTTKRGRFVYPIGDNMDAVKVLETIMEKVMP